MWILWVLLSAILAISAGAAVGFVAVDSPLEFTPRHKAILYVWTIFGLLLGLDAAKKRVAELRDEAHTALLAFGTGARRLNELADWIALRKN